MAMVDLEKTGIYNEMERTIMVKKFLDDLLGKYEQEPKEPYKKERMAIFWTVLRRTLTPEEEQLIFNFIYGLKKNLNEKENFLFILACAKLRGSTVCVNTLSTSEEALKFLGKKEITQVQDDLLYKNSRAILERVQRLEDGPWIIGGQIWF